MRKLLPESIAPHPRAPYVDSTLHLAASGGHLELVRLLLDAKADIEVPNQFRGTPLIQAFKDGHSDVALLLLARGANPIHTNRTRHYYKYETGLLLAAQGGCDERVISELLSKGIADKAEKSAALLVAAGKGNLESITLLLDAEADIEAKDKDGKTSLLVAAEKGNPEVVKLLLNVKANIEATDKDGKTPLLLASRCHPIVAELLLSRGANPQHRDKDGETALICAAETKNSLTVTMLLTKSGIDVNLSRNFGGDTVLLLAAHNGHVETVQPLLNAGADFTKKDVHKRTALMLAIRGNHTEVVALLLEKDNTLENHQAGIEKEFEKLLKEVAYRIAKDRENDPGFFEENKNINRDPDKRSLQKCRKDALEILSSLLRKGIVPQCMRADYRFKEAAITAEFLAPFHQKVSTHFAAMRGILKDPPAGLPPPLASLTVEYMLPVAQSAEAHAHKRGREERDEAKLDDGAPPANMGVQANAAPQSSIGVTSSFTAPGVHLLPAVRSRLEAQPQLTPGDETLLGNFDAPH